MDQGVAVNVQQRFIRSHTVLLRATAPTRRHGSCWGQRQRQWGRRFTVNDDDTDKVAVPATAADAATAVKFVLRLTWRLCASAVRTQPRQAYIEKSVKENVDARCNLSKPLFMYEYVLFTFMKFEPKMYRSFQSSMF